MTLNFVEPGEIPDTINILLYAGTGSGKTTAACSAPGPILYLNADGLGALRFPRKRFGDSKIREVTVDSGSVLNEALLLLRTRPEIKTVVLDTLSAIYMVLLEEKCKGGRPTLQQYGDVGTAIERFCRELRDLSVNVVLLAQEFSIKDESSGVIERLPYTGTNNPALGTKLMEMMDVVGYCGRTASQNGEKPRYMATLVDAPGRRGKDRTDSLGAARDLDLSDWINTAAQPEQPVLEEAA